MGVLKYLESQGLNYEGRIRATIDRGAENDLRDFIEGYRDAAVRAPLDTPPEFNTSVYLDTWDATPHHDVITQLGLLLDRIYIPDPTLATLHHFAQMQLRPDGESRQRAFESIRMHAGKAVRLVNSLAPLIRQGVVALVPSAIVGPTRSPGSLYADDFFDPEGNILDASAVQASMPDAVQAILPDIMDVAPAFRDPDTGEVEEVNDSTWARTLILGFHGDPHNTIRDFYEIEDISEHGKMWAFQTPSSPMEPMPHLNWRRSERLKLAIRRWKNIQFDLATAQLLNSQLLSPFPATKAMLDAATGAQSGFESEATRLLSLELPFFSNVKPSYLAKARREEIAFDAFRSALRQSMKALAELRKKDLSHIDLKEQEADILRSLIEVPLRTVRVQMKRMARRRGINIGLSTGALASLLAGTLFGSLPVTGAGAAGIAVAAFNWVKGTIADSGAGAVRDSSGYFYWKATGQRW